MIAFTIPLNPVTKKNSSQIVHAGKYHRLIPSKRYRDYEQQAILLIPYEVKVGIDYPVNIKATYYRDSKRRVDITNLESALMDVLVKAGVLNDDCAIPPIVVSTDGSRVEVDKINPRTEIVIERVENV